MGKHFHQDVSSVQLLRGPRWHREEGESAARLAWRETVGTERKWGVYTHPSIFPATLELKMSQRCRGPTWPAALHSAS